MKVAIENLSKINLIDVLSDGISECLIVEGKINSLVFRTNLTFYKKTNHYNIDKITNFFPELDNISLNTEILEKVKSEILMYLSTGYYIVEITDLDVTKIEIATDKNNPNDTFVEDLKGEFTYCIYTEKDILFFTKSESEIDINIVNNYKNKILNSNKKPIIIILGAEYYPNFNPKSIVETYGYNSSKFIIKGHHKLLAYKELNISPKVVSITKLDDIRNLKKDFINEFSQILNKDELKQYKKSI